MYELHVENMGCGSCVAKISKALQELDQNVVVEIDRIKQRARIQTDETLDAVCTLLAELGYPARPV